MGSKIKGFLTSFGQQWKTPAPGKYVSYKEVAAYSVGGMGVQFIAAMVGQIMMSATCLLIGAIYGMRAMDLAAIAIVATILSFVVTPLRGMLLDNTKSKRGKFRPLILWMGLPTAIFTIAMAFIPPSADYMVKLVLIGVGFNILNILYNQFFYIGYANLVQVMTPNTDERTTIISISSIVFSMAPTITGFLLPLLAKAFPQELLDIKTYRLIFPVFCIIGLIFSYIAFFGTKERIVVPKRYVAKVKFWHGMKSVFSNKYFWINNITTWFAFARGAAAALLTWVFVYQIQNGSIMAVLTTVIGTASLVGMVTAPFLIKKIGKRNLMILINIVYAACYGLMFFFSATPAAVLVLTYISFAFNATTMVTTPSMNADALDYQQWKTGERLEGFSGNMGMIGSVLGLVTVLIIPFVLECFGLLENYDVLFDAEVRVPIFQALCLFSAIGGILTAIPFFFYDLTEKKHAKLIADLKQRALEINKEDGINKTIEELERELAENQELEELMSKLAHKHQPNTSGNSNDQLNHIIEEGALHKEATSEEAAIQEEKIDAVKSKIEKEKNENDGGNK